MKSSEVAFIAHIEADNNNLNTKMKVFDKGVRLYEQEAIRCVESIRERGGWLSESKFYMLCCTDNQPSQRTIDILRGLDVIYVHDKIDEYNNFSSGFLTIPYTGFYFEDINPLQEQITIKIDLDNELVKEFPKELVEEAIENTVIGQYNDQYDILERFCYHRPPFDTSLIITAQNRHFYRDYYRLCFSDEILKSEEWLNIRKNTGDYWLEEFVVDYMYEHQIKPIKPLQNYQYGFDYPSLSWFIKNNLWQGVYMSHGHINSNGYDEK